MNTAKDIGGGNKVSTPAYSGGVIKNIIILRDEPTIKDAIAAVQLAFFQNKPKVSGAHAPAKTISKANIKYIPGLGIKNPKMNPDSIIGIVINRVVISNFLSSNPGRFNIVLNRSL